MKKALALLIACVMGLSLLAGCGGTAAPPASTPAASGSTGTSAGTPAGDTVVIGYASNASDENENSKMQAFRDFVDDWNAAGKTPALEAVVTVADSQVDKQISDVESMVALGAKGIALSSVDPTGLLTSAQSCLDKGIDIVEMRGMELDGIITFNLCDETTMAEMAYDWYAAELDAEPDLVLNMGLIYGTASQTAQLVRVDHLVELLQEKYPGRVNVVEKQYCDWDTQKAMECMENWLQTYQGGGMNCIVAAGAMMACGASNAITGAGGQPDDFIITTTDATADVLYAINEGLVDMTVGIDAYKGGYLMAQVTAEAALDQFEGNYFDCGTDVLNTIDSSNIADWYTA